MKNILQTILFLAVGALALWGFIIGLHWVLGTLFPNLGDTPTAVINMLVMIVVMVGVAWGLAQRDRKKRAAQAEAAKAQATEAEKPEIESAQN